jgi:hypothetical protein
LPTTTSRTGKAKQKTVFLSNKATWKKEVVMSSEQLKNLNWHELQKIFAPMVEAIPQDELHNALIEIFPLKEGENYIGSMANHYRGRLKREGKESFVRQMSHDSMCKIIVYFSEKEASHD